MEYTVKQLAQLAGITPRTLRYYHRIGLLSPVRLSQAGYRIYGPEQVDRLQQILFYRALDFPLEEIKQLLDSPSFHRLEALQGHLAALKARRSQLDGLIQTVEKTLKQEQGGYTMTDQEKFEGLKQTLIQRNEETYGQEVRSRYGDQEANRSNARLAALSQEEYQAWTHLEEEIQQRLEEAVAVGEDPAGPVGKRSPFSTAGG